VSSGSLQIDWIFGGGFIPGMSSIAGEEQSGKCVVGSTLTNVSDGFLEMQEYITKKGFSKVKNLFVQTEQGAKKVSHTFKAKSNTIKLKTYSGYELEGTPEHPVQVIDSNLDFKWVRLDQLTSADWVVTSNKNTKPLFGTNPFDICTNMATIMGYLTANGHCNRLSTDDSNVIKRFQSVVTAVGAFVTKVCTKSNRTQAYDITTGGNYSFYKDVLQPLGYVGHKSKLKSVPLSIRQSTPEIIHEFLESYFECDSHINGRNIIISSASPKLINHIYFLLHEIYKINSSKNSFFSLARNSRVPTSRKYYNLVIQGDDAKLFLTAFKRAKVQQYSQRIWSQKGDNTSGTLKKAIPYVRDLVTKAYDKAKVSANTADSRVKTIDGTVISNFWRPHFIRPSFCGQNKHHYTSEYLFNKTDWDNFIPHLSKIDDKLAKKLARIVKSGCSFEKIETIKYNNRTKVVYDITVPETKSFIANGIVSHNTTATYHTLANSHAILKLPYTGFYDAEGAISPKYTTNIFEPFGLDIKHLLSKEGRKDGFYYFKDQVIEKMFDYLKKTLHLMPDKNWSSEAQAWCYYFRKRDDDHKALMSVMGVKPDQKLSAGGFYVCPTDNSGPEGFFGVDSFAALLTRQEEEKEDTDKPKRSAMEAAAFAEHLKRVVVDLAEKKVIMLGTNQLGSHVRQVYGHPDDQQYEKGGNALKFYSIARARFFSRAGSASKKFGPFEADKDNSKFGIEQSVEGKGFDRYAYKEIKNTKNKFGKPGLKTFIRVWVSDTDGKPRGIDPAFDVFMHLRNTFQLVKTSKGFQFDLKDSVGKKRAGLLNSCKPFKFEALKTLVIGEYTNNRELIQKGMKMLGIEQKIDLRASLLKQLKLDDSMYSSIRDSAKVDEEDLEDEGDEDYENM